MKINWIVRFKNPHFWTQIGLAIAMPVLAYFGLTGGDFTTWGLVWETIVKALASPYVVGTVLISVYNAVQDPTTQGFFDSESVLTYKAPGK